MNSIASVRSIMVRIGRHTFRAAIALKPTRKLGNAVTNRLSWRGKQRVNGAFGYALQGGLRNWIYDDWRVNFMGRPIFAPLRAEELHMDWVCAMTLMGHDVVEKQTYANLLASDVKPDV